MTNGGGPRRVLVVEDDQSVIRMLRYSLQGAGFEITEVTTGGEALSALGQGVADAVVLDLGLPDAQGRAVLERLRQLDQGGNSQLAWLVISALDRDEANKQYGQIGDRFLAKPFDPWELVRRLEELLSRGDVHH